MLLRPNRRQILGLGLSAAFMGQFLRTAHAQSGVEVLGPIFVQKDWRNPDRFLIYERLAWTMFELKYIYPDSLKEYTGLQLPPPDKYIQKIQGLTDGGLDGLASRVSDTAAENALQSFVNALEEKRADLQKWFETIGVIPQGTLSTGLQLSQALFSLIDVVAEDSNTLEERREKSEDEGEEDCAIFYPFC